MTTKHVQNLVTASYTNDTLDEKKVNQIAELLRRKDLKAYIRGLKLADKKHKVYIAMPAKSVYNTVRKDLQNIFGKKEFLFEENPSLLLGIRILDNDMEYDMSLENKLNTLIQGIYIHYDE